MGRNYRPASAPAMGGPLLSELTAERVAFACDVCNRNGAYRRTRLIADFGDIPIEGLPLQVAERRKCVRAVFPPFPSAVDAEARRCGVRLAEPLS